jgi:hypothetical protein
MLPQTPSRLLVRAKIKMEKETGYESNIKNLYLYDFFEKLGHMSGGTPKGATSKGAKNCSIVAMKEAHRKHGPYFSFHNFCGSIFHPLSSFLS